jgi:hypothetical protein
MTSNTSKNTTKRKILNNYLCISIFRNKVKEETRQGKLSTFRETGIWPGMKSKIEEKVSWSNKVDQMDRKSERKRKKDLAKKSKETEEQKEEDLDDLEEDYKLLKRAKKGKVS